ncbi:DUF937 domain-containing protein [Alteraurantiacibacter aquimixticola]|uniref:DUF937 domain-containing protein n=1 Tax=Alteraurantiacibacter aquimixticola TaxID=2489173 RepID=A0A4T3F3G3_9SPHN|nr:DUF937 domain-containing protein [Alteraurantiacibacter aquimixticola]TIX51795.1 DUF937 domain-containing protein [Alteraurantiacibacter aquimixticola]
MNLSQVLQQSGVIISMANELGIDEQTARIGAGALLPAIVAGMGRQTTSAPGAGSLGGLGDILAGSLGGGAAPSGGLGGALAGGLGGVLLDAVLQRDPTPTQPGNDILGQIFGSKDVSRGVAEEVSGSTGISSDILKKMLPILAMAVVGYMMNGGQPSQQSPAPAGGGGGALGGALGSILTQVVTGMVRR